MTTVARLLNQAKEKKKINSDNALAKTLETHRQVIHQWRHGESFPSEENIAQLAEMAGDDPGKWLLAVKLTRSKGKALNGWESIAQRLSSALQIAT